MKKHILAAALLTLATTPALAQTAAKLAPADAASSPSSELPADIKTYVSTHPSDSLPYSGKPTIGHPVDGDQIWQAIPAYPAYRWTNLNGQKVVVEKKSGHVVAIY
jgi:hypothetical protein